MTIRTSKRKLPPFPPRLTQPEEMKTKAYVYGVEKLNGYDAWALFNACGLGEMPKVKALLAKDPRLVNAQYWYQFPIHMAVLAGHADIVRLLLERGADPGQSRYTYNSWNKLLLCARERGYRPIESLLQRAYTPPYAMKAQEMKRAIRERHEVIGHEEFLGCVLARRDAGLLDHYLDSDPTVPMRVWSGAYPRVPGLIRRLLARGLDPNNPDWLGRTFLHFCAANGDWSVAATFVKAGANINARDLESKGTPLAVAVRSCSAGASKQTERGRRMIEFLLKRGAMTNLPDDEPWATPLAWARKRGLADIEQMLLKHGAHEAPER